MGWAAIRLFPWKYIGAGVGALALALLIWRAPWAESRGFHKRDAEVALIIQDRDTALSNARVLSGALDSQNAAVAALQADGDKRAAEGKAGRIAAEKANQGLANTAKDLRRSATLKPAAGDPCVVSETLARVGKL